MTLFKTHHHLVGGTLLIAGTSIGVGMLALPVATAAGGFLPALIVYLVCWIFMVGIARLIVEACLWMPSDANLITISRTLLGTKGAIACWILYLFLFYCLLTAHTAAGGGAVQQVFMLPNWISTLIYLAVFAPVVYLGTRAVDRVNIGLMIGVAVTYLLFVFTSFSHFHVSSIYRQNWSGIWSALPIILTAFGFQNLIPTLVRYMDRDHQKVRKAIWIGTTIPLALYVVWEMLVLGIVPLEGAGGLAEALKLGQSAVQPLQKALQNNALADIAEAFSFFAMTTSFVGISIAFVDFWADGLKWENRGAKHLILAALVFIPPLIFVCIDPTIFIKALELAGGIGMVLLLGVLPIVCVWAGRYIKGRSLTHQFIPGGKITLAMMLAFCILVLAIQFV